MQKQLLYYILLITFGFFSINSAQDSKEKSSSISANVIKLPEPQKEIGKPLMQALNLRGSSRTFSSKEIPLQELSNLLWAGFGINRGNGKRTAPSAHNWQEIDIYIIMANGVYTYKAEDNSLVQVMNEDIREITSTFEFVKTAPLNLVYIADNSKLKGASESEEEKLIYNSADAGFIIQNVYLYCASQGLSSVVYGGVNRKALTEKLNLRSDQKIILAQSVGYPKN